MFEPYDGISHARAGRITPVTKQLVHNIYHFLGMVPHNVILNMANGDTANLIKVSFKPLQLDFTPVI